jgi:hypothetical protein
MEIKEILTDKPECPNVRFLEVEGLKATQSSKVIDLLKELKKENFEIAIEIGTQEGGFSLLIKEYLGCEVHTWDIGEWNPIELRQKLFKKYGISQRIEDCFEDKQLPLLLRDKRKKILFCDGGNKGNEFSFFGRMLNKGDFIGAHDYFEKVEDRDNDVWTTCELIFTGIEGAVKENNMIQKHRDLSLSSVWALYEKRDGIKVEIPEVKKKEQKKNSFRIKK